MAKASNARKEISFSKNTGMNIRPFHYLPQMLIWLVTVVYRRQKVTYSVMYASPHLPNTFFISDGVMKDWGCWDPALIRFIPLC